MTDNTFKQMREQMEPGQEALDRLQAAIDNDRFSGLDKGEGAAGAGQPGQQAAAAAGLPSQDAAAPHAHAAPAAGLPGQDAAAPHAPAAGLPTATAQPMQADAASTVPQAQASPGAHTHAAPTAPSSNGRKRNPLVQYLLAAAAIVVLFVAAGVILQNWLPFGNSGPGLPGSSGSSGGGQLMMDSGSVRSVSDYQEIYDIIAKSRNDMDARNGGGQYAIDSSVAMAPQGDSGSAEAAATATAPTAPAPAADSATGSGSTEAASSDPSYGSSGAGSGGYSETNVQVKGIDEGDIVKTDGKYIYVLSYNGYYELVVYSAAGQDTVELSRVALTAAPAVAPTTPEGDPAADSQYYDDRYYGTWGNVTVSELYISGTKLVVIGSEDYMLQPEGADYPEYATKSFVSCYDVSDPSAPALLTEFDQSGYFHSSRLNGDTLYLISNYYPGNVISPDNPGGYVPLIGRDGNSSAIAPGDVCLMPEVAAYPSYTVVSSIDLASLQRIDQKSILGQAGTVYMSADNLYIGSTLYIDEVVESYQDSVYTIEKHDSHTSTQLMRVGLSGGKLDAAAQCTIAGQLLNQFSLDEYQGNLRLVLTVGRYGYQVLRDDSHGVESYQYDDPTPSTNALYVLSPDMTVLGSIDGLAADERIYSARFDGAVGYMVTFKQIDPLFAIDLSDPASPKVTSELKIPGFSTYLHPFGAGRLLGLGYETTDGRTSGIKLSMFDVSDPFDVRELNVMNVADMNAYSDALYNHKAVLVDVEKNIIGIPVNDYQGGQYNQSYHIYQFTEGQGFTLKGRLELSTVQDGYYYGNGVRGLYIGGCLYVYSGAYLDVFELQSLAPLKSIQVSDYSGYGNGYGDMPMPEPVPMPAPGQTEVE